jgi:hypothetical protein
VPPLRTVPSLFTPLSFDTSSQSKSISAGGVSLTLSAPKSFNTDQALGTGTLPSVTLDTSSTNQLISATGDVLDLVPTTLPLSKSVTVPTFGKLSYTLAEADLTAGLQLAQQFVFQPTAIDVTVTFDGKKETGQLGSSFTFTAPTSLKGSAPLSVTYSLVGNLESEIGYVGNVTLTVNALSGQVGSAGFGPLATTGS